MLRVHGVCSVELALAALLAALAIGCGGDDSGGPGGPSDGALYAMMVQVYTLDDRNVYVSLSDTVDITSTELDAAREFPGVANLAAIDGRLLVSSGSEPTITEFDISSDHEWSEGRTVSFADYPLLDNANFYYQFIVDADHALLPFDGTKRILWNPAEMAIEGTLDDTSLSPAEPGLTLEAGGNRNSVRYDDAVMQAFFYHDDDWYDYGARSHVVVYQPDGFAEDHVLEVDCPGMSIATRDEEGNTYFSSWGLPGTSIVGEAPATCVARVAADKETVELIDLRDWTDGRLASNFRYVGAGRAFANVLHHEVFGVESPEELGDDVLEDVWASGPHWQLWLFDVEQGTGSQVDGIDVAIADGAQFAVLDGRSFVFLPYDDWGRTKGYELLPDGTAVEQFDTVGDVFKWERVR